MNGWVGDDVVGGNFQHVGPGGITICMRHRRRGSSFRHPIREATMKMLTLSLYSRRSNLLPRHPDV